MKKFIQLLFILMISSSLIYAQIENPVINVSSEEAVEYSPVLAGGNGYLYAAFTAEDSSESAIVIKTSSDNGLTWEDGDKISQENIYYTDPYIFTSDTKIYVAFRQDTLNSDILLYENNLGNLENPGIITVIAEGSENLYSPAVLEAHGDVAVAYFNRTAGEFVISQREGEGSFREVYSAEYTPASGSSKIDGTSGHGLPMFVYNTLSGDLNQMILLEKTLFRGWVQRYATTSLLLKEDPSVASYGNRWIVSFRTGDTVRYIYKTDLGQVSMEHLAAANSEFTDIGILDAFGGKAIIAYEFNGRLFKKITELENLPKWELDETIFPEGPGFREGDNISLWAYGPGGGILFANERGNIFYTGLGEIFGTFESPEGLQAQVNDTTSVTLTWVDSSPENEGYLVYRKDGARGYWKEIENLDDVSTYTDENLAYGSIYSYKVRAYGEGALSGYSNSVTVETGRKGNWNTVVCNYGIVVKNMPNVSADMFMSVDEGITYENGRYEIPSYDFLYGLNALNPVYDNLEEAYMEVGNISDNDIFLDIYYVFDGATSLPPEAFGRKLFLELHVDPYILPDYTPIEGDFHFKEGAYAEFTLEKTAGFIGFVNQLGMSKDSLSFYYIGENGVSSDGITTINTDEYVKFKASHFSKFAGGRSDLGTSDVEEEENLLIPETTELAGNYPNPFNPSTRIEYALHKNASVKVTIYDILGNRVTEFDEGFKKAGRYTIRFDASGLSSGVYLYTLEAVTTEGNRIFDNSGKMLLLK